MKPSSALVLALLAVLVCFSAADSSCTVDTCRPGYTIIQHYSGPGCTGNVSLQESLKLNECGYADMGSGLTTTCSARSGGLALHFFQTFTCDASSAWITQGFSVETCIDSPSGDSAVYWCDIADVQTAVPTKRITNTTISASLPTAPTLRDGISIGANCSTSGCGDSFATSYLYRDSTCSGSPHQIVPTNLVIDQDQYVAWMSLDTCYRLGATGQFSARFSCDQQTAVMSQYFGDCSDATPFMVTELPIGQCNFYNASGNTFYYKNTCPSNEASTTAFSLATIFALLAFLAILL